MYVVCYKHITNLILYYLCVYKIRAHSYNIILCTESNNVTDGISCIVIVCTYGTMLLRVRPCHIFTRYYYIRVHVRKCVYFFFTLDVRDGWLSYSEDYTETKPTTTTTSWSRRRVRQTATVATAVVVAL